VAGFAADGWSVIGTDCFDEHADAGLDRYVAADLAAADGVDRFFADLGPLDRLDAVVNNAAIQVNQSLVDTDDATWDKVFRVNLDAAFRLIRQSAPLLAQTSGAIINIGSVHSLATSSNVAAYAISKGALATLTRTAALELAHEGVRCNIVLPGAIRTPMLQDGLERRGTAPDLELEALVAKTPLGRISEPEEIVPTVLHLADPAKSGFLTGQAIVIDGGASLLLGTE
jgi:NAD(P)-dependent dehydrogenase (short-subunit alcohol dehydrogenase family)